MATEHIPCRQGVVRVCVRVILTASDRCSAFRKTSDRSRTSITGRLELARCGVAVAHSSLKARGLVEKGTVAQMPAKSPTPGASDPIEIALEKGVRELVARYGRERVREAILRQTKAKRGPRPRKDWHILWPIIADDARQLLDGRDPFSARTNYAIASEYAAKETGHSHTATVERIERKLRKYRKPLALADAASIGSEISPHHAYLRMLERWRETVPELAFDARLEKARQLLANFEIRAFFDHSGSYPHELK